MTVDQLKPNKVLRGPIFPEPVQVIVSIPMGDAIKLVVKGLNTSRVYEPILTPDKLAALETTPDTQPFDGDAQRFRLAVEALRLSLAYEYDPYFSLSIARVDPLPHQLEAVYQYFMALPRIRFLLADDPGAGKTIMAGLLLKEGSLPAGGSSCRLKLRITGDTSGSPGAPATLYDNLNEMDFSHKEDDQLQQVRKGI